MVSSTAIPIATLAVIIEPISQVTSNQPIAPKASPAGKTFGSIANKPARTLRSMMMIANAMRPKAVTKLTVRSRRSTHCALYTRGTTPVTCALIVFPAESSSPAIWVAITCAMAFWILSVNSP